MVLACSHEASTIVTTAASAFTESAMLLLSMTTGTMQRGSLKCLPGTQVEGLPFCCHHGMTAAALGGQGLS